MGQSNRITLVVLFLSLITLYGCQDLGSTRHAESIFPWASTVRDLRLSGGYGNNLCCRAGFGQHAQTSVARGYVPNDGGNHGHFSDPLGLLRDFDCFATSDRMERGSSFDKFPNGRGLRLLRP